MEQKDYMCQLSNCLEQKNGRQCLHYPWQTLHTQRSQALRAGSLVVHVSINRTRKPGPRPRCRGGLPVGTRHQEHPRVLRGAGSTGVPRVAQLGS